VSSWAFFLVMAARTDGIGDPDHMITGRPRGRKPKSRRASGGFHGSGPEDIRVRRSRFMRAGGRPRNRAGKLPERA
jgi:hypothetical protein